MNNHKPKTDPSKEKQPLLNFPKQSLLTGRAFVLVLVTLIQVLWFVGLVTTWIEVNAIVYGVFELILLTMIVYLVNKNESPEYRISWIVLIALLPIFGGLLYIMFGNKRPTRRMSQQLEATYDKFKKDMPYHEESYQTLKSKDAHYSSLAKYLKTISNMPVYNQTKVDYYPSGEAALPHLLEALKAAEDHIFIEFFIVAEGDFLTQIVDVLAAKAQEGVDVRFMYDDFGSLTRLPKNFVQQLEELGIRCLKFNPFKPILSLMVNTRDHRKIIDIDGKVAFTGGINLADEYINEFERFGYWKDNVVQIQGPAVYNFTFMFLEMWNAFYPLDESFDSFRFDWDQYYLDHPEIVPSTGYVQPFDDTPLDDEALGENNYLNIIYTATDYVYIYTPYLAISYEMQSAIEIAAKRGVDIRIITPAIPDKKIAFRLTQSYYQPLLEAGVKIYEFTPGFMHAKTFISDGTIASIGSINLDYRSLYLHFEVGVNFYFHPVIEDVLADFQATQAQSQEIQIEDLQQGLFGRFLDAVLRIAAPLF